MLRLAERDDLDHVRTTTAQFTQALSALGQVIADRHSRSDTVTGIAGPVVLAPALLNRVAAISTLRWRWCEAKESCRAGSIPPTPTQLADTFEADSVAARYLQ